MTVHCDFKNPEAVSIGMQFDDVRIKVHSKFLFVSEASGKMLSEEDSNLDD